MGAKHYGIESIGIHFPSLVMSVEELARVRHIDPNKYTIGLGCQNIAICPPGYGIVDLATEAAKRALSRWNGNISDIALIATGTESSEDMSRPLSAWIADKLGLRGAIRSYEVKHACYGGTLALRQAIEWKLSGLAKNKVALIIAADICEYEQGEPAEPTQGAGAIAMIIGNPLIAEIEPKSYPWSKPAFDFWRPVGRKHPLVEGQFSLKCYQEGAFFCFNELVGKHNIEKTFKQFDAMCFHTPFPKMVKKAFYHLCESFGLNEAQIEELFNTKVMPTMEWNLLSGNCYTASLWIAVTNALRGMEKGHRLSAFSYGSGCGAELLTLKAGELAREGAWNADIEIDLAKRKTINGDRYEHLRQEALARNQ